MIVVWEASRAILNSRFDLPPDRRIFTYPPRPEDSTHRSRIVPRSRMTLFRGALTLVFDDTQVSVRQYDERQWNEQAIICYLTYRTFLCYDCLVPTNESIELAPEVDAVVFQLHRNVVKYLERDGHTIAYNDTQPCEIVVHKQDIADYLGVFDHALAYALSYYILGCNTQRYFLVEFYKCLEIIKSHFANEKEMMKSLEKHGFVEADYREAKKLANDRMRPLSISRHAPLKDVSVCNIDTKWLFDDPRGKAAFEAGERACRSMIDAYLSFRKQSKGIPRTPC